VVKHQVRNYIEYLKEDKLSKLKLTVINIYNNMPRSFEGLLLSNIELFCLVAQHQGFTAAARSAGMTTAALSRAVSHLEKRLGVRLFVRTTRRVRLTEDGQRFFERCHSVLDELREAEREVTRQQVQPTGLVRLSLPTSYGHYRVLPTLTEFARRYPGIRIELQLSNHSVNFAEEGYDLAVRARNQPDSSLIARKLEDAALVIVAAPVYLMQHGTPQSPEDLAGHECIQFVLPRTGATVPWVLHIDGQPIDLTTTGRLCCTDDILGPVTLARSGAGLIQTYRFLVEEDIRLAKLVEVMQAFGGASRPFSLLYPSNAHIPLRVRVLIEYLSEALRAR
jgi:DNA-binding transcriptional LysR family regulator